jgi:hypothetical protein
MNTRKISYMLIALFNLFLSFAKVDAQQISPYIYGQNAWMPDSIGSKKFYGSLGQTWTPIAESGVKMMRYGGIGVDENKPTKYQYIKMVDNMRSRGIEPILAVAYNNGQFTAAQAADIVNYVNNVMGRNVKYWIIANEPDLAYGHTSASQVAPYIKAFASAMKAADPTIKTVGPETAGFNKNIITGLTTAGGPYDITGKDANGRFYIDYLSFHTYPMGSGNTSRSTIISDLTAANEFEYNLNFLNSQLATCNSYHGRTGTNVVKTAVTEININYRNPSGDNLYGTGANSFIGGQYWAEILGIAAKKGVSILTFWSVVEGNTQELNIGYLNRSTFEKKPAYYHFKMMSENFKGNFAEATDNQLNVKTFGSKDGSQVAVMVMNQDAAANMNYTIRLNNDAISASTALKVNVNAGIATQYTGTIDNQSTQMLIFDLSGNLIKKIDYKLSAHASAGLPPQVTNITVTAPALTATITAQGSTTIAAGGSVVLQANTGTGYAYQWMKNGAAITGATAANYTANAAGSYTVKITAGTATVTSAPVTVTVTALTATITPSGSTTIPSGGNVILKANTGTGYVYQWMKNGAAISGATTANYTATAAGSYTVKITAGTATATSAPVTVTVSTLTATITPSGSTAIATGGNVILKANTGTGYVYQWMKNGAAISGATTANYTATAAGSYTVKITAGTATATSAPVTVTVSTLTATITPSGSTAISAGGNVILKANTGTGYTYQWKKDGVSITGATAANYTATTAGSYQVKVMLGTASAYSAPVAVTVTSLTATITPSGSTAIPTGGSVILKANTGTGYTYQWKKNGVNITGATAANYTATSAGSYQVKVMLGTASAYSAPVSVTSGSLSATITVGGSTNIAVGGSVMLYANTGSGYTYQWKKNGISIPGATASSYKVTAAGSYQLKVMLGTASAYSSQVSITQGGVARTSGIDSLMANDISKEANAPGRTKNDNTVKDGHSIKIGGTRGGDPKVGQGRGGNNADANTQADRNETKVGGARGGNSADTTAEETQSNSSDPKAKIASNVFGVKVGPNPSTEQFGFTITGPEDETINVKVFDMNGRLVIEEKNVTPNQTLNIGHQLAAGHYIAQVEQGNKKQVIKLVKSN